MLRRKKKPPKRSTRELLLIAWHRLRGGELTPARAAFSVGIGILVGCTPFFGLHWLIVAVLCLPLRLDLAISYISTHIANPLVAPFIVMADIKMGAVLLGRPVPHLSDAHLSDLHNTLGTYFIEAAAGSLVVGTACGVVGGVLAALVVSRRSEPPKHLLEAIERTSARYGEPTSGEAQIVLGRLKGDPALERIDALEGELGALFDGGCSRGELGLCLQELGRATTVTGVDVHAEHVATAQAAQLPTDHFSVGDLADCEFDADTVLLSDVLRSMSTEAQASLLQRVADSLKPGGRLIVRELDAKFTLWTRLTALLARVDARLDGFKRLKFRTADEWVEALKEAGLECRVESLPSRLLHGNVMIVGSKR